MTSAPPLLYLSAADVQTALPMADAIAAMRAAFTQLNAGQATMPARLRLNFPDAGGVALFMPSHSGCASKIGIKVVTLFAGNRERGLPLLNALVMVFDASNGLPLAVMDGASLTAIRTGAASGVATEVLARPDAAVAAIFGAGVQGRTQLEAVQVVRPLRLARVYDPNSEAAEEFAFAMSHQLGIPVERSSTPAKTLANADIVCTATTAQQPVFKDANLAPGTHINAIGSYRPDVTEVPAATVARARVVVDQFAAARDEAGDLLLPLQQGLINEAHFATELGAVLAGQAVGRRKAEEITLFKSVGVAIQDLCAAAQALETAQQFNLGIELTR